MCKHCKNKKRIKQLKAELAELKAKVAHPPYYYYPYTYGIGGSSSTPYFTSGITYTNLYDSGNGGTSSEG